MTDRQAELDAALERVIAASREHLAAVVAAAGRSADDRVWRAYVALNNASFEYDELLLDVFDEVTPWAVEAIDPEMAARQAVSIAGADGAPTDDAYGHIVSVRQRRDYMVPSVSALLRLADATRQAQPHADSEPVQPVETVGEALLELMAAGDGSLCALQIPELESLDGVVVVAEVAHALDPDEYDAEDGTGPFELTDSDRLVDRLDEHAYSDFEDDEDEDEEYDAEDEFEEEGEDEEEDEDDDTENASEGQPAAGR